MRRGEFDHLPGAGQPLAGIVRPRDPGWWIKQKVESEGLTGFAPPVFQLRKEHERLEQTRDELPSEAPTSMDSISACVRRGSSCMVARPS